MLNTTLKRLRCPVDQGALRIDAPAGPSAEIRSGTLACASCGGEFLILAGVALLVEDTREYLLGHVKGISKLVPDEEIPDEFRAEFREAKSELEVEHIEEDLEAERVTALYLMNHYLRADSGLEWWKPESGTASPLIAELVRAHWDQGPFARIQERVSRLDRAGSVLELGCGTGGLHAVLAPHFDSYLGTDASFAGIALARHLALGTPYPGKLRVPGDLLKGTVSREIRIPIPKSFDGRVDFVVSDFARAPFAHDWDLCLSLNTIDMLEEPEALPRVQHELLRSGGLAIQSCPYIWHEAVAAPLRERLPAELRGNSARAVEWLYAQAGFRIEDPVDHVPWLFFKHVRQLEIYSVHLFTARKG